MPAVFERVWGTIKKEKFKMLIRNPSWLSIEIFICEKCYVKFTDASFGETFIGTHIPRNTKYDYKLEKKKMNMLNINITAPSNPNDNNMDLGNIQSSIRLVDTNEDGTGMVDSDRKIEF